MSAIDRFPLLMAALKEELKAEVLADLGQGEWIDQNHSEALGRNRHAKACRRLIRELSPDATYHDGRWLIRRTALDAEIVRKNRRMVESGKLPETLPPPAMTPVPALPLAKTEAPEPEDETGIYAKGWLDKMRGAR